MRKILLFVFLLPCIIHAQTLTELSTFQSAAGKDITIVGQGGQLAASQNILLAAQGTGGIDITGIGAIPYKSVKISITPATGTVTGGVITFEQSDDATFATGVFSLFLFDGINLTALPISSYTVVAATSRVFVGNPVMSYVRARISTAITGTTTGVQAISRYFTAPYIHPVTMVAQPLAANLNANVSGTLTANQGSANAAAWLANPLNIAVTTTGDIGAKTATFSGATQTNANAKGAFILLNIGTVSGTTPTMVIKVQESADGGTTWQDMPNASTASLIATGTYGIKIFPGITPVGASATAGTTAVVSNTLPKTWRLVYTIGGTTPSFTITNVQVSYIL